MKIKINRNILWAEIFVKTLVSAGVKYACISPGSRSTPLTYVLASNEKITSWIHIDERCGAFFAAGLARQSGTPVLLVCTSGTAVAEFYPAVIEAFQQRIPLIVCTADRPKGAFLKGTNQTINQHDIYRNHIRWFAEAGLPEINHSDYINAIASKAVNQAIISQSPVHINFSFEKPFEPDSYTDEIDDTLLSEIKFTQGIPVVSELPEKLIESITDEINNKPKGLFTVGPSNFPGSFNQSLIKLSTLTGYPVLADGCSQLRSGSLNDNIITNYDALFRNGYFLKYKPEIIIHFGSTMTSKGFEDFNSMYDNTKYLVNRYNEVFDPSGKYDELVVSDEEIFINSLISSLEKTKFSTGGSNWMEQVRSSEALVCRIKKNFIHQSPFPDESRIITELFELLPDGCNLMLSNSMPVRDFDYYSAVTEKNIKVFHNRGASGIDGIISTALGIAAEGGKTILITGDLAFYHDMNGLLAARNYNIPLIIILINNNGGGIFKALPVSRYTDIFEKYFITPHNLSFELFVNGYGGNYSLLKNWEHLRKAFKEAVGKQTFSVLEIKTDSGKSLERRREFWKLTEEALNDNSSI